MLNIKCSQNIYTNHKLCILFENLIILHVTHLTFKRTLKPSTNSIYKNTKLIETTCVAGDLTTLIYSTLTFNPCS